MKKRTNKRCMTVILASALLMAETPAGVFAGDIFTDGPAAEAVFDDGAEENTEKVKENPEIKENTKDVPQAKEVKDPYGVVMDEDGRITFTGEDKISSKDDTVIEKGFGFDPEYNPFLGTVTIHDGNYVILQGGKTIYPPEGSTVDQSGCVIYPDLTVVSPDGTAKMPDGTKIDADGKMYYPDGSVTDEYGFYIRPATPKMGLAYPTYMGNHVRVNLKEESKGADGYDFVIGTRKDCIKTHKYYDIKRNCHDEETDFTYLPKGTYYVYCHSWFRDQYGQKVFSKWSEASKVVVKASTPAAPIIKSVKVKVNSVTVTYTKSSGATGYDVVLAKGVSKVNGELRPVNYGKNIQKVGKNTYSVTFKKVKKGAYYVGIHSYNRSSELQNKVFSRWVNSKKISVK